MNVPFVSVEINESRYLRIYIVLLYGLLLVALFMIPVALWIKAILLVSLLLHWRYSALRYFIINSNGRVNRIEYSASVWRMFSLAEPLQVSLKSATVWRWLVVMNFYCESNKRRYNIILWPDSVDSDVLRRLRMTLLHMDVYGSSTQEY